MTTLFKTSLIEYTTQILNLSQELKAQFPGFYFRRMLEDLCYRENPYESFHEGPFPKSEMVQNYIVYIKRIDPEKFQRTKPSIETFYKFINALEEMKYHNRICKDMLEKL